MEPDTHHDEETNCCSFGEVPLARCRIWKVWQQMPLLECRELCSVTCVWIGHQNMALIHVRAGGILIQMDTKQHLEKYLVFTYILNIY